ncbi:hypothetical protein I4U23_023249 [Adineta vaga]|nr:hypothetical protein I4U23_023249 [Adineta vaga]
MFYTKTDQTNKTIHSNDTQKIIDYLNHVFHCIDYDIDCSILSNEDQHFLFYLALNLSPDLLIGKVFFPHEKLSNHLKERFYQMNQIGCSTIIPSSIIISGRACQIKRIFIFEEKWLNEYYLEPIIRLQQQQYKESKKSCLINT